MSRVPEPGRDAGAAASPRPSPTRRVRAALRPRLGPVGLAEHELDDPVFGALGHVDDADGLALAQDRGPVADRGDLDHAVRDEDDGPSGPARRPTTSRTRSVRSAGSAAVISSSMRMSGLDREGAREIDDPQRRQGQAPGHGVQVESRDARARAASARNGSTGVSVRRRFERMSRSGMSDGLLVDGDEAASAGVGGRVDARALCRAR